MQRDWSLHRLGSSQVELARTEESQLCKHSGQPAATKIILRFAVGKQTYQGQGIKALSVALALEGGAKCLDLLTLLRRQVARVTVGLDRSHEGEVEVIVLGVEIHASGVGGSSHVDKFPGQRANEK